MSAAPRDVDEYLAGVPAEMRAALEDLRAKLLTAVPDAVEGISYGMPVVRKGKDGIAWYSAWKNHWSLFPATESLLGAFPEELGPYFFGKGTFRFPADKRLPAELVARIVQNRIAENDAAQARKSAGARS
jgi:uncharacterized protein YdhG (YjbR/CyaY superfamily)